MLPASTVSVILYQMSEKTRNVRITNTGECFDLRPGETILQAALRNGIDIPHGCRHGVCGVCISRVIKGRVEYPNGPPLALFEEDLEAGMALCCAATSDTDLELEIINLGENFEPWEEC